MAKAAAKGVQFTISNEGRSLFKFLSGRGRIGRRFAPRFWESEFQIYGGLSYINHEARLLWYPSDHLNSAQGILVGTYNTGEVARTFATRDPAGGAVQRVARMFGIL